ncbi:MAG: hypothetical protein H6830_09400 [Planctomycetes bacterium]|nr:hypothetical protein [Planctomycetota bacterium]MCB9909939.1 hypothetical protein [Planctomycetota bacterium]MCB9912924.1 hypothetical protein [Planctomycetota bacterium]HPF12752.1 alpha-2-macroglobulin family protein [Planctomycetota bacterium]
MTVSKTRLPLSPWLLAPPLGLLFVGTLLAISAVQDSVPPPRTGGPPSEAVRIALLKGATDEVLQLLSEAAKVTPDRQDQFTYYRAVALADAERWAEAASALKDFAQTFPQSPWKAKASFRMAEAQRMQQQFAQAEAVYRAALIERRSVERQTELAQIYVKLADFLIRPNAPDQPATRQPKYQEAIVLYGLVLQMDCSEALKFQSYLQLGESQAAIRDSAAAAISFSKAYAMESMKSDADHWVAGRRWGEELVASAQYPQAQRAMADFLRTNQGVAVDASKQPAAAQALLDARAAAQRLLGDTWLAMGRPALALGAWKTCLDEYPAHPRNYEVMLSIANQLSAQGRTDEAVAAWNTLATSSAPASASDPKVLAAWEAARRLAWFSKGSTESAAGRLQEAITTWREYVRRFPDGEQWTASQTKIVDSEHDWAYRLLGEERWEEGRRAMEAFVLAHPLDSRLRRVQFDLARSFRDEALADEPVDAALLREAVAHWEQLAASDPNSAMAGEALFEAGVTLEEDLSDMEQAVRFYRRVTQENFASQAQNRLANLVREELSIETERTFRSGENPALAVETRNAKQLKVQIYRLDLESYFRKHHSYQNIEALDLDLISADSEFTFDVPQFREYAPLRFPLPLNLEGPGVWAVAVSSPTLRATTLVLASDIDLVTKIGAEDVFVYAQDMTTSQPASGVRLLVSSMEEGAPAIHEVTTDASGVARWMPTEGRLLSGAVHVLAVRDGHVAATDLALGRLTASIPVPTQSLVYSDRPAYRPGDTLHWRAIVRESLQGSPIIPRDPKIWVRLLDVRGNMHFETEATLGEFGTGTGSFEIPGSALSGPWTLQLESPSGGLVASEVTVEPFRVPRAEVRLEADQTVVMRGMPIRVLAVAQTTYGAPLADTPLRWDLPGGTVEEVRTDAQGRASIEVPTEAFNNDTALRLGAALLEEGVSDSILVFVATQGFTAQIGVDRPVELAGSSFPIHVTTLAPDGKGLSVPMQLEAYLRLRSKAGVWSEERLFERTFQTDGQGKANFPIAIDRGGTVVLRTHGVDQYGQRIEAQTTLTISGAEDEVLLRMLTDRSEVVPDESVEIVVANRARAGKALLTLEANSVLEYRMVDLAKGVTRVPVTLGETCAPNVRVALAYMDGTQLHEASTEFSVLHTIQVEFLGSSEDVEAGQAGEVTLRATDLRGNPVRTEFSLSIVEAALYDLYPDRTPGLQTHFVLPRRNLEALATGSTCTFAYSGQTTAIASAILEDAERVLREVEWARAKLEVSEALARPSQSLELGLQLRPVEEQFADLEEMDHAAQGFGVGGGGGAGGRFGGRRGLRAQGGKANEVARSGPPEDPTALWTGSVLTDDEGIAHVAVSWPDRATRWRLTAHGVGVGNHFGSATAERTTKQRFFVELLGPEALLEGDQPRFAVRIHNGSNLSGIAQVELQVGAAGAPSLFRADVPLGSNPLVEHLFEAIPAVSAEFPLQVTAYVRMESSGQTLEAAKTEKIPVLESGMEVFDTASGVLTDARLINLELAGKRRILEISLGAHLESDLMAMALGETNWPTRCRWVEGPAEQASNLLGALAIAKVITRGAPDPRYAELRVRIQGLIGSLSGQQSQGGWAWEGANGKRDAFTTAHVALAMAEARRQGFLVRDGVWQEMADALMAESQAAEVQQDDLKAFLQHALARMGSVDFAALNRLHRNASSLSPAGQAHLALALSLADRKPMAEEVLALLVARAEAPTVSKPMHWEPSTSAAWFGSTDEVTAWCVLALQSTATQRAAADGGCDYLVTQKPWFDRKAAGLAVWALAQQQRPPTLGAANGFVSVQVGDQAPTRVALASEPGRERNVIRVELPDATEGSAASKLTIRLQVEGNLHPSYMAVLRGFSPTFASTDGLAFRVGRQHFLADAPRYRGKQVRTGFSTLLPGKRWENERSNVHKGELIHLQVSVAVDSSLRDRNGLFAEYLELEVPIPAGLEILETKRPTDRNYRKVGSSLVFPIGTGNSGFATDLELVGAFPGEYVFAPAVLRSAYRPDRVAVGTTQTLRVLDPSETDDEPYLPTPDERFYLGKAMYGAQDLAGAYEQLLPLIDEWEARLRPEYLAETARMLLFASIQRNEPNAMVRFFEIIKERDTNLVVPIEQLIRVGDAYASLGEHERGMLIFRASLEETFGRDLKMVGTLDPLNQWVVATQVLDRLVNEYPDFPVVVEAELSLADRALSIAESGADRVDVKQAGLGRAELTAMGIQQLRKFLAQHAQSSLAPEAGLSLVAAFFSLDDYVQAAAMGDEFAARFTKPEYLDSFRYSAALAHWYLGLDDQALTELKTIAEATYPDARGNPKPSVNHELALYIIAQIYHAAQNFAAASEGYAKVKGEFPDAAMALQALNAKALAFAEDVIRVQPGEPASLELTYRNLQQVELLAYPVDLMTLYLREKDLSRVTQVNLAGISPTLSQVVELPMESPCRLGHHQATLALPGAGAYLIMARSGEEHASALVLVSDLEVQVQDFVDGRVRVQVLNTNTGKFERDADVRVLGTGGGSIQVGKTDPRGLFATSGVEGRATVIARVDSKRYAFHLGTRELQPQKDKQAEKDLPQLDQDFYLQNFSTQNQLGVDSRNTKLGQEIQADRKGVQVLKVK